jgi:hypothetical protein
MRVVRKRKPRPKKPPARKPAYSHRKKGDGFGWFNPEPIRYDPSDASSAGKASGWARRNKANEKWRDRALGFAIATRKANRGITQEDLAVEIINSLEGMPGEGTLIPAIREWELLGLLPPRDTNT